MNFSAAKGCVFTGSQSSPEELEKQDVQSAWAGGRLGVGAPAWLPPWPSDSRTAVADHLESASVKEVTAPGRRGRPVRGEFGGGVFPLSPGMQGLPEVLGFAARLCRFPETF